MPPPLHPLAHTLLLRPSLPCAGHIDGTESPAAAAVRECKEEAGVDIALVGVLRTEYDGARALLGGPKLVSRLRLLYLGVPVDPLQPPKSAADGESDGAAWMSLQQLQALDAEGKLRGREPLLWAQYLCDGGVAVHRQFVCGESEGPMPSGLAPDTRQLIAKPTIGLADIVKGPTGSAEVVAAAAAAAAAPASSL